MIRLRRNGFEIKHVSASINSFLALPLDPMPEINWETFDGFRIVSTSLNLKSLNGRVYAKFDKLLTASEVLAMKS